MLSASYPASCTDSVGTPRRLLCYQQLQVDHKTNCNQSNQSKLLIAGQFDTDTAAVAQQVLRNYHLAVYQGISCIYTTAAADNASHDLKSWQ
jgi:hypothetical protein